MMIMMIIKSASENSMMMMMIIKKVYEDYDDYKMCVRTQHGGDYIKCVMLIFSF